VNHSRARDLLSAHLERDLGDAERAAVETHLAECSACREELDELRSTVDLLHRMAVPPPPPYLATRVMARIAEGEARAAGWRGWLARLASPAVAASFAAAAAALAVLTLAEPARKDEPTIAQNRIERPLPRVPTQVGPRFERRRVPPDALARLGGAGHPHSRSLAAHFERPTDAVVVSWQSPR
jgi:anti-sigma factor RsiW